MNASVPRRQHQELNIPNHYPILTSIGPSWRGRGGTFGGSGGQFQFLGDRASGGGTALLYFYYQMRRSENQTNPRAPSGIPEGATASQRDVGLPRRSRCNFATEELHGRSLV
ncbi:unnamed protein product [Pleuronectes platessa]|uniref:Uncharacterized protein n=1 Tax=Pleuronectes platessa TaxID=8262 RepID=A0A9N7YQX7_PLEPL|nr:unnamed protein product [Pleuronectes platessa]